MDMTNTVKSVGVKKMTHQMLQFAIGGHEKGSEIYEAAMSELQTRLFDGTQKGLKAKQMYARKFSDNPFGPLPDGDPFPRREDFVNAIEQSKQTWLASKA